MDAAIQCRAQLHLKSRWSRKVLGSDQYVLAGRLVIKELRYTLHNSPRTCAQFVAFAGRMNGANPDP